MLAGRRRSTAFECTRNMLTPEETMPMLLADLLATSTPYEIDISGYQPEGCRTWSLRGVPVVSTPGEIDISYAHLLRGALQATTAKATTVMPDMTPTTQCGRAASTSSFRQASACRTTATNCSSYAPRRSCCALLTHFKLAESAGSSLACPRLWPYRRHDPSRKTCGQPEVSP